MQTVVFDNEVAGYPSLLAVVLFLGGAQLVTFGVIGEYLGRMFNIVKQWPLHLVEQYLPSARPSASPTDLSRPSGARTLRFAAGRGTS